MRAEDITPHPTLHIVSWEEGGVFRVRPFDDWAAARRFFDQLGDRYCEAVLGHNYRPGAKKIRGGSGLSNIVLTPAHPGD